MKLIHADAIPWLKSNQGVGSIITSLPDAAEVGMELNKWEDWFTLAARLCLESTSPECITVFYQTDRKHDGVISSKVALLFKASSQAQSRCLWHKIVLRNSVGKVDLFRPGFTSLIAFSKMAKSGKATADVMLRGRMNYRNAMGETPAKVAIDAALKTGSRVVDPFCGQGTIPIMANRLGCDAIGIDNDIKQIKKAKEQKHEY